MDTTALSGLVGISRAAFAKRPPEAMLRAVAEEAAALVRADAVAIVLADARERPVVAAGRDGGARPRPEMAAGAPERLLERLRGRASTVVPDAAADEDAALWAATLGLRARAVVAVPFDAAEEVAGALVAGGDWRDPAADATVLEVVAVQVQLAIRTTRLAEAHQDQMAALARMVVGLREQAREHVSELLTLEQALDEGSIERIEALVTRHHASGSAGGGRVESPVVAGLLLGETSVARTRGIELRLTARSALQSVPSSMGDLAFVSVISNLLGNAFDAVQSVPGRRRRVSLHLQQRAASTAIEVRDWGVGLGTHAETDIVRGGYSSKGPGRGTGLALVNRLVTAAGGRVEIDRCKVGTRVKVTVPNG